MEIPRPSRDQLILLLGDILVLILVTLYGFASHDTLGTAGLGMLTTFVPVLIAWLLIAPLLKVYDTDRARSPRALWRPFWAMILAAPMAGFLRGLWLGRPVLPIFVIVVGGVSAIGLTLWRALYWFVRSRRTASHG